MVSQKASTHNLKDGYLLLSSFFTSSSTLTSYSVTKSTEFFFSSTLPDDRIACEPCRIKSPALRASVVVNSRIDCRSDADRPEDEDIAVGFGQVRLTPARTSGSDYIAFCNRRGGFSPRTGRTNPNERFPGMDIGGISGRPTFVHQT